MSEDTQSENAPVVVESLDDVIDGYNGQVSSDANPEPTQNFENQQAVSQPQVTQTTLDPFDEAQMAAYTQNNANQFGQVDNRMNDLNARLANFENVQNQQKVDADVKGAVEFVNKIAGHDNDKWVEFQIAEKVRNNPGFANLWNTRNANPSANRAFNKALTAIGNDMKSSTEMKSDPQLVENQRAANLSQQNIESGSTGATTQEDLLSNAGSEAERDALWQRMVDS